MGCGKNLVDCAIPTAGDDAINFFWTSISNGFAGQSYSVSRFPCDPHLHNLAALAQRVNGRSQSNITGCLAVENDADACHLSIFFFSSPLSSVSSSFLVAAIAINLTAGLYQTREGHSGNQKPR